MPSIAPIITINSSPVVEVRGASGISYDEINASIGLNYDYLLYNIYQSTSSISQLLQPVRLRKFNKFGDKNEVNLQMMVDPYQDQASLNQSMFGYDYAFDSNNAFFANIEANTSVGYRIEVEEQTAQSMFNGNTTINDIEFFKDYVSDF
jgi:hypothetical protein